MTAPSSFLEKFEQPADWYPTHLYRKPQIKLRKHRFRISIRGPAIWNDLVGSTEKEIQSSYLLKTKVKSKLVNFENEITFFNTITFKNSLTETLTYRNNVLYL